MSAEQSNLVSLGLVQMRCRLEPEANLRKAVAGIREAARGGAQIVCLQELLRSQYFCQRQDPSVFDLAQPIPSRSTAHLAQGARGTGALLVAAVLEGPRTG